MKQILESIDTLLEVAMIPTQSSASTTSSNPNMRRKCVKYVMVPKKKKPIKKVVTQQVVRQPVQQVVQQPQSY
jgi:hypothetical protein